MRKKPDRKAKAIARLVQNVADAGGPMKLAETVDDRAYRRGVRDGKRAQRSSDLLTFIALMSSCTLSRSCWSPFRKATAYSSSPADGSPCGVNLTSQCS